MNIVARIKNAYLYPLAQSIVSAQSLASRVKALGKKPVVHFEQPYGGQKILLLALYEKGRLRADIENLLITAKSLGMYVLAVNTLKVLDPDSLKDKIDCYIERPNFGRDFGSYQTGFQRFYKKGWEQQCERLLMLNDSLFYSKANLRPFLEQMITTEIEVLGATENHELEHHLGSFCISIEKHILQQTRFQKFWARYANTDVRPNVIKRGEMKLSKTLRGCVSSPDNFLAYFSLSWLIEYLESDQDILYRASDFYRLSNLVGWKRPSLKAAAGRIIDRYLLVGPTLQGTTTNTNEKEGYFVDGASRLINVFESSFYELNLDSLKEYVLQEVKNDLTECFTSGSQIHQNNILLHHLGMPIIKLDGLYRGMFSVDDVEKLANQLDFDEKNHFRRLMYSKPFGGNTLSAVWRVAFNRGLI